jgi:hypothetical protein
MFFFPVLRCLPLESLSDFGVSQFWTNVLSRHAVLRSHRDSAASVI